MKKLLILAFLLFTQIKSNELIIAPLFYGNYQTEGKDWKSDNTYAIVSGFGILSNYNHNNLSIKLDFYNNRFFNITKKPYFFNNEQGLARFHRADYSNQPTKFDFDVSNIKINYKYDNLNLYFGKFDSHWGPGVSSLILSNKSPSFSKFGFLLKVGPKFKFEYLHGSLKSLITDSLNINYYSQDIYGGNRNPNLNRFIAAHRIDLKLNSYFTLGLNEIVVYGVRNIDMLYCIPFLPFWSTQHYLGDLDNIIMSADFKLHINKKINLYGAILIDEWTPSLTFDKQENRNWFGYQLGFKIQNILLKNDNLIAEFNWTDHRIYRHRYQINDFYNHGYPIGFWGGPHSEEIFANYVFKKFDIVFEFKYSKAKRGILNQEMLDNQYSNDNESFERFEDGYESISKFELNVSKKIYKALIGYLGFSFIDWENANFDPYTFNNQNLIDIKKNSLFLGLSYNFDIKNQKTAFNEESIFYSIEY